MESLLAKLSFLFQGVDSTFSVILIASIFLCFGGEVVWVLARTRVPGLPKDDNRLKFIWSLFPALILALMLFVHPPRAPKPTAEIARPVPPKISASGSMLRPASTKAPVAIVVPQDGV